jgi:hypothetical protein
MRSGSHIVQRDGRIAADRLRGTAIQREGITISIGGDAGCAGNDPQGSGRRPGSAGNTEPDPRVSTGGHRHLPRIGLRRRTSGGQSDQAHRVGAGGNIEERDRPLHAYRLPGATIHCDAIAVGVLARRGGGNAEGPGLRWRRDAGDGERNLGGESRANRGTERVLACRLTVGGESGKSDRMRA